MGDDVLSPDFPRMVATSPRERPLQRKRPGAQSPALYAHAPHTWYEWDAYLDPDGSPHAPTAAQTLSLVTFIPHAFPVASRPSRGLSLGPACH